jgi:hypothetical protein
MKRTWTIIGVGDVPGSPRLLPPIVKRGARWAKLADVELEPGEPTYRRKGKSLIRAGRVEKYARLVVGLQNEREGKRALDQIAHALCTELSHFHEKIADPN